jgi:hypothetical protein
MHFHSSLLDLFSAMCITVGYQSKINAAASRYMMDLPVGWCFECNLHCGMLGTALKAIN